VVDHIWGGIPNVKIDESKTLKKVVEH